MSPCSFNPQKRSYHNFCRLFWAISEEALLEIHLRTIGKVYTIIPENGSIHLTIMLIQTITKANCMSSLKVLDQIV